MAPSKRSVAAESDEEDEYVVEEILKAKVGHSGGKDKRRAYKYYVKWQGYGTKDNTWEPSASFAGTRLLDQFWDRFEKGRPMLSSLNYGEELTPDRPAEPIENYEKDDEPKTKTKAKAKGPGRPKKAVNGSASPDASLKRKRGRPSKADSTTSKKRKSIS